MKGPSGCLGPSHLSREFHFTARKLIQTRLHHSPSPAPAKPPLREPYPSNPHLALIPPQVIHPNYHSFTNCTKDNVVFPTQVIVSPSDTESVALPEVVFGGVVNPQWPKGPVSSAVSSDQRGNTKMAPVLGWGPLSCPNEISQAPQSHQCLQPNKPTSSITTGRLSNEAAQSPLTERPSIGSVHGDSSPECIKEKEWFHGTHSTFRMGACDAYH